MCEDPAKSHVHAFTFIMSLLILLFIKGSLDELASGNVT